MTVEEFLDSCEGVKPAGNGWVCQCPSHDDREASLGVTEGEDGRILLQCHAGCETVSVLEAMKLGWGDLFPNTIRHDLLPEHVYDYTDELGNILFQAVRFPNKRFRQRHHSPDHPDARDDGWVWDLEGVRRVPYRLPELIAAVAEGKVIYITEGEKDADRLTAETGRVATCNPMGAGKGKWRDEFSSYLKGADVIIVQDRDEAGRRHATAIKDSLLAAEVGSVRILQARRGKDLSDHFDNGFKCEELLRPRVLPADGIVSSAVMAEAGLEYLQYRPEDLPGHRGDVRGR